MTIVLVFVIAAWILVLALIVGLCRAARVGDTQQQSAVIEARARAEHAPIAAEIAASRPRAPAEPAPLLSAGGVGG